SMLHLKSFEDPLKIWCMRLALAKRVNECAHGNQGYAHHGACEINVVTDAAFGSPAHKRQQVQCLAEASEHDDEQTRGAECLDERGGRLGSHVERRGSQQQHGVNGTLRCRYLIATCSC